MKLSVCILSMSAVHAHPDFKMNIDTVKWLFHGKKKSIQRKRLQDRAEQNSEYIIASLIDTMRA